MSISLLVSVSSFRLSLNRPPEPKNLKKAPNNRAFWGNKMNWGRLGLFLFLSGEGGLKFDFGCVGWGGGDILGIFLFNIVFFENCLFSASYSE